VSNLQRQILYTSNDLNGIKSQVAAKRLKLLNPAVSLHAVSAGVRIVHQHCCSLMASRLIW